MQEVVNVLFSIKGFDVTLTDIASIATAISVIIGIFQLAAGKRVRQENARRDAVKEAVEIAKIFQREILDDISFTLSVYKRNGIESFVEEKVPFGKPLRFSLEEAKELFGEDCEKLHKEYEARIDQKILDAAAFENVKYEIKKRVLKEDPNGDTPNEKDEEIDHRNKMIRFLSARGNALNKLEWIAMLINSHAADGTVIYQSLHQSICSFVRANYLYVAYRNTDTNVCDKYYSNLIELYNDWVSANCKKQKENDRRLKKLAKQTERLKKKSDRERSRSIVRVPKM